MQWTAAWKWTTHHSIRCSFRRRRNRRKNGNAFSTIFRGWTMWRGPIKNFWAAWSNWRARKFWREWIFWLANWLMTITNITNRRNWLLHSPDMCANSYMSIDICINPLSWYVDAFISFDKQANGNNFHRFFWQNHDYFRRMARLLAIYTDLELCSSVLGLELDADTANRIQLVYRTHLEVKIKSIFQIYWILHLISLKNIFKNNKKSWLTWLHLTVLARKCFFLLLRRLQVQELSLFGKNRSQVVRKKKTYSELTHPAVSYELILVSHLLSVCRRDYCVGCIHKYETTVPRTSRHPESHITVNQSHFFFHFFPQEIHHSMIS